MTDESTRAAANKLAADRIRMAMNLEALGFDGMDWLTTGSDLPRLSPWRKPIADAYRRKRKDEGTP